MCFLVVVVVVLIVVLLLLLLLLLWFTHVDSSVALQVLNPTTTCFSTTCATVHNALGVLSHYRYMWFHI